MNHLLHCVPGAIAQKGRTVFSHVRRLLRPGGVLFGSTILSQGIPVPAHTRALMAAYDRRGIFHNTGDFLDGLRGALEDSFESHELRLVGVVALFAGQLVIAEGELLDQVRHLRAGEGVGGGRGLQEGELRVGEVLDWKGSCLEW